MPETKRVRRSAQPAPRQRAVRLFNGDSVEILRQLPDNSIDSVVCDPPYGLSKEPDMFEVMRHWLAGDDYKHTGGGFMGKSWDSFVPGPAIWRECLRVLKPGGHLLAFFGSRTYDMGTLAIRLAGFEIRDQIMWVYGSGFPKSLDVSKAIDKNNGRTLDDTYELGRHIKAQRLAAGYSVKQINDLFGAKALCNHWEAQNINNAIAPTAEHWERLKNLFGCDARFDPVVERLAAEREVIATKKAGIANKDESVRHTIGASKSVDVDITAPSTEEAKQWEGWGTALKPAHEPICVARKPLAGTVAANVLAHGTGGLNIDGCRVDAPDCVPLFNKRNEASENAFANGLNGSNRTGAIDTSTGRWPANIVHDGSDEVLALFPGVEDNSTGRFFYCAKASKADRNYGLSGDDHAPADLVNREEGSAGIQNPRAGAGRTSGSKNPHPTVKPIALMEWLVRLITPPGGVVLDPFMGSGSTGIAAVKQQFKFVGVELSEDYFKVAQERIIFARGDR